MTDQPPVLIRDEETVRWLILNRPEKRNALDAELVAALRQALSEAATSGARMIVLSGAGKVFSAGADLRALHAMRTASREQNLADSRHLSDLFRAIVDQPQPVVAAVNGHAIAGGAGLAIACDLTIAVEDARIGFTEVRIGFVPAIVLNFILRVAGEKSARDLCLTGRRIAAKEAARLGLVNEVVAPGDLEAAVARVGAAIAETSPSAVAATKRLFLELRHMPLEEGLRVAALRNADARATPDCREGITAFLEKRKPRWQEE